MLRLRDLFSGEDSIDFHVARKRGTLKMGHSPNNHAASSRARLMIAAGSPLIALLSVSPLIARAQTTGATAQTTSAPSTQTAAEHVGPSHGGTLTSSDQLVRPAGATVAFNGRPVDLLVSPDGKFIYAKDNRGLVVVDAADMKVVQELKFEGGGGSMIGLAINPATHRLYATQSTKGLLEFELDADGRATFKRTINLPGPKGEENSFPCGVALSADGATAYVCLSRNNTLAEVNLVDAKVVREIETGIAPFDVAIDASGARAFVSTWGGRRPTSDEQTATSAGTPVAIDARGVAITGGVSFIDLANGVVTHQIETGLGASDVLLSPDGARLFVANANHDTVTVLATDSGKIIEQIVTRPDADLPFGSMPHGLALSKDGKRLFVACAGNNAIAVVDLASTDAASKSIIRGWIPTDWYPGALALADETLFVANIKGVGSRNPRPADGAFNTHNHRGTLQKVALSEASLPAWTEQVRSDGRVPQILAVLDRSAKATGQTPRPVPDQPGGTSVFEHVVYIIKENRTYDQIFGDLPQGNGKAELCTFGREVTPNQHAIAEQFALLDNFYCNGVLSADGHSWATEGNVTPYLERSFGGFNRSYTFGDDPLTYSSSGFVWDHVLGAGRSFRNYGEFDEDTIVPPTGKPQTWTAVYQDWTSGRREYGFKQRILVENVRRYSHPRYPGWNMKISDQIRADLFLEEFKKFEQSDDLPNFIVAYLPQDHTSGVSAGEPTPRACVADNDLAVGRIVDALSHSRFWPQLCVFVIEDDPQNGWDHVDGHRSTCLVVSPYTKRKAVVSEFYNQASVVHTMERILGATAQNQLYGLAPLMTTCFNEAPDLTPYIVVPNNVPLDELNPPKKAAAPEQQPLYAMTASLDLSLPDRADEETFNRVLWHSSRGAEPYPAEFAGAHGHGLAALGLRLDENVVDDDDHDQDHDGDDDDDD